MELSAGTGFPKMGFTKPWWFTRKLQGVWEVYVYLTVVSITWKKINSKEMFRNNNDYVKNY